MCWCDCTGRIIPTDAERADAEPQGADAEPQRTERLAEKLRELAINPDEVI